MPARHPNGFARIKKSLSRPSCVLFQFKSVFSQPYSQPVIHCVPRPCPRLRPRSPVLFRYRSYEIERYPYRGPVKLVKNGRCRQTFCTAVSMVQRKNINAQSTVTPNTLFTAACGSPEGPERQRDDECRRRVGNCVEPDLTRAPATSHASPNLSPLSPLRCSPCTVVRPSLCVPPSRAFGAAERREAAAATSALTSPARSLASSALRTLHS